MIFGSEVAIAGYQETPNGTSDEKQGINDHIAQRPYGKPAFITIHFDAPRREFDSVEGNDGNPRQIPSQFQRLDPSQFSAPGINRINCKLSGVLSRGIGKPSVR